MMPDTVEIENVATTKTAATIDPDGDYMVGQTAAGDTFKAFVEQVVRGVLEQIVADLTIGDDVIVDGRIGIGTPSPGYPVHLYSTTGGAGVYMYAQNTSNTGFSGFAARNDLGAGVFQAVGSADVSTSGWAGWVRLRADFAVEGIALVTGGSKPIALATLDTIRLYIAGGGNVGIGTTSPSAKLQVAGGVALIDGMTAPGAISGYAQLYVDSADGDLKVKFGDGTVKTIATDT